MGQTLSNPVIEKFRQHENNDCIRCATTAIQGWRTTMEDAHAMSLEFDESHPDWYYFAVFDGHAGSVASKYCADTLHLKIIKKYYDYSKNQQKFDLTKEYNGIDDTTPQDIINLTVAIHDSFVELDDDLKDDPKFANDPVTCGTTALALVLTESYFIFANCGDSRAFLCRDKKVFFQTKDHKPNDEDEKNRIVEAGGYVCIDRVNGNLAVSRAIGDYSFKTNKTKRSTEQCVSPEPTMTVIPRSTSDEFVTLACDGIWDVLTCEQVVELVVSRLKVTQDYVQICDAVVDTCLYLDSRDNMTCMLILFPNAQKIEKDASVKEEMMEQNIRNHILKILSQNEKELSPVTLVKKFKPEYSHDDDLYIYYKIGFINSVLDENVPNRDKSQDFSHPFGLRNIPQTLRLIHSAALKQGLDIETTNNEEN